MRGGGGVTASKVSKIYGTFAFDHIIIAVVNTKLFINKKLDRESWYYSINHGSSSNIT